MRKEAGLGDYEGWGAVKCAGWLTGSSAKLGGEVAKERCRMALRSLAVDYPGDAILVDSRKNVTESTPRVPTEKEVSRNYRDIAMRAPSPLKCAEESILKDFGYSAHRAPPCGKRLSGTEIWRDTVGDFYRIASASERRDRGVSSISSERLNRTSDREAAW